MSANAPEAKKASPNDCCTVSGHVTVEAMVDVPADATPAEQRDALREAAAEGNIEVAFDAVADWMSEVDDGA